MAHQLRAGPRVVTLGFAAALFLLPSTSAAQNVAAYTAFIDRYVAGDADGAVGGLSRWSRADVTKASEEWARTASTHRLCQATMLHTDTATALAIADAPDDSAFHITVAQGFIQRLLMLLAQAPASAPQTVFRSGVEIVELDVSVIRAGQPVQGLTARDFALTDNGVAQDVQSVTLDGLALDRLPLSVTLVLDISRSVAGDRLTHLVQAGQGLVAALRPGDRAALITFSHVVNVPVSMTGNLQEVSAALGAIKANGATALRDAVHLALELQPHDRTRPLVLVFTDGVDTTSWLGSAAVLDSARRVGVVVHAVRVAADSFLDRLAETSGGRTWSASSDRELRELFTRALEEMRARYLLTYTPRGVARPGWHELKVKLKNGGPEITARPGYFVSESSPLQ